MQAVSEKSNVVQFLLLAGVTQNKGIVYLVEKLFGLILAGMDYEEWAERQRDALSPDCSEMREFLAEFLDVAGRQAWEALQSVPSYVEVQAALFASEK